VSHPQRLRPARIAGLALTAAFAATVSPVGAAAAKEGSPRIAAPAAVIVDARDGHVLYRRKATDQRAIASATKLMTALVAIEELPLKRRVRAVNYAAGAAESRIDLRPGERMAVADLLRALLLESANDAAETLAVRGAGSVDTFVARMNRKARDMGLAHTRFANPVGLDDPGNHSSALDLARIARRVLANDFLAGTVDMSRARLTTGAHTRVVANRNRLIARNPSLDGVKTGHTQSAGYVLVGSATRKGARLVTVVLGEPSEAARDDDTLALLRYGFAGYRRVPAVRRGATLARAQVEHYGDREVGLVAAQRVSVTVREGERVRTVIQAPGTLGGPIAEGAAVGKVRVFRGRQLVRSVPLVTADAVPKAGFLRRAWGLVLPVAMVGAGIALWVAVRRRRRAPDVPVRHPARAD
jgi:serine-type D-Ala-D-Ala carboxypeptidase (penicillin-binding protein 5/6)